MVQGYGARSRGKFHRLLRGEVMADTGDLYDMIQPAVDASEAYTLVGVGTWDESVTVPGDNHTLDGFGRGTYIDCSSGPAVEVAGDYCVLRDLRLTGTSETILSTNQKGAIQNCTIQSGDVGIDLSSAFDWDVVNTDLQAPLSVGIDMGRDVRYRGGTLTFADTCIRTNGEGCDIEDVRLFPDADGVIVNSDGVDLSGVEVASATGVGVEVNGHQATLEDVRVESMNDGIRAPGNNTIISGCHVLNNSADGLVVSGSDQVITGCRIGGNGGTNLETASATNPTTSGNSVGAL